jgi:hypothetical protein
VYEFKDRDCPNRDIKGNIKFWQQGDYKTANWQACKTCPVNDYCAAYEHHIEYLECLAAEERRKKYIENKKLIHLKKHPV